MKVLNLYAGIGGNRKLWKDCEVTAIEINPKVSEIYKSFFPEDKIIVTDAHEYLLNHYEEFDFIWTSPPCQTHSKMAKATRHKLDRYPDMTLYQEIIFLQHFFKGYYVVENVDPFYEPLIQGKKLGRHMYWSNFHIGNYIEPKPDDFINLSNIKGKIKLMDWLGMQFKENIYLGDSHDPSQVLRNCVHPNEGAAIMDSLRNRINHDNSQLKLF